MKGIKLYPSIEEVFLKSTEEYKAVFFPLLTIDLSAINKGPGKVHFVTVYPSGNCDVDFPKEKCDYNFIKFKLVGDKYLFEADIKEMPQVEDAVTWYKEAEQIYEKHKDKYFTKTASIQEENNIRRKENFDHAYYIEGVINYWVTRDKFLETRKFIQGNAYTYENSNHERKPYENIDKYDDEYDLEYFEELIEKLEIKLDVLKFIGTVTAYNYSELGEDELSLFINTETNEVLQYFDWS